MGYLLDQMEKVASFAEQAMMEKIALTREQREAKRKAADAARKAGAKKNKVLADAVKGGDLSQAAAQLGVGVDEVADMTPRNIARTFEKGQGKPLLKAVQDAVTGGGTVADVIPNAPGAGYEDLQNMLKSREGIINDLAGARDEALAKVDQVRAHGAGRARKLLDKLRGYKGALDDAAYWGKQLRSSRDHWMNKSVGLQRQVRGLEQKALGLEQKAAQLTDDLDNFRNLGRFSGVAKWIKGNPKKALGAAILGGGGLLGGAGAAGYAMNDGSSLAPKPVNLGGGGLKVGA